MSLMNILDNVELENIYKTVLDLEGPRYPLDNMEQLNMTADYIIKKFESYGIEVEVQEFYVLGFVEPFRNIIGIIGDKNTEATIIGSHYDSVRNTPGANDNLSSVAVSLEVARLLSTLDNPPSVRIAVFTLEECNPGFRLQLERKMIEAGYYDRLGRYTSPIYKDYYQIISKTLRAQGLSFFELPKVYKAAYEEIKVSQTKEVVNFFKVIYDTVLDYDSKEESKTHYSKMGSFEYAKKIIEENIKISKIINMDTIGWIYTKENTQKVLPFPKEMLNLIELYKTEHNSTIGNFICVIGEKNSSEILQTFLKSCKLSEIEIPYLGIDIPLNFKDIAKMVPDTLRSDHAPFWEIGVPGIFISDSANFRSDFYHTGEDTYAHIDFYTLVKITKAVINTILNTSQGR
ncbi:hypothetical protein CI105_08335 [Candidatus Izimaplasma bacterium ZiA1]|uniref:M28 family peptidase n=1 Tax=Candidatus Izimoplasma sp. ZiA1 TaxID=2024899 RepID=UPI000BAA690B|nr:hypothetical protein CI105_08335 [Candidatus Izimaplasma bacterium ZiA1]